MNVKLLILLGLIYVPILSAETVYKIVDADGNIVFSDTYSEGAEAIEIKAVQTVESPDVPKFRPTKTLKPEPRQYQRLEITSPVNDATIRSNEGKLLVNIALEPALNEKDEFVIFMNGKPVTTGKASSFELTGIERGTHQLYAAIRNEDGDILKQTEQRDIHFKKASKLFPNSPTADTNTGQTGNPPASPPVTPSL